MGRSDRPEKNVWAAASKVIRTRNPDQCSKRWKDALDPSLDHSPWSKTADARLERAYFHCGPMWNDIRAKCFPQRSTLMLKNRCVFSSS